MLDVSELGSSIADSEAVSHRAARGGNETF
jgi:hypothetical protein